MAEIEKEAAAVATHHGKSDDGFKQAVEDALKDFEGSGDFSVKLSVSVSPNPGKISYLVTLTSP